MPRPNTNVVINGTVRRTDNNNPGPSWVVLSRSATETLSGTTRRKPNGKFINPTSYSLSNKVVIAANGMVSTTNRSTGSVTRYNGPVGTRGAVLTDPNAFDAVLTESGLVVPPSMRDQALIKARLAMKQQDVNLGVAFAERKRTADLVTTTATSLVKSLRNLRRGRWRQAWRDLGTSGPEPRGRSIPQKWLEMQYGWKPLLSDVYGSVDALARRDNSDWRVTGKGSVRVNLGNAKSISHNPGYTDVSVRGWKGCFVRIDAVPENDMLKALSALGVTNPAVIGWELVPFSFMVDWFLPIGQYLDSLDAMLGYGPATCSISSFSKAEWIVTRSGGESPTLRRAAECSPAYQRRIILSREARTSVPLPTLPRFRDGRSLNRMANALSILALTFGR